MRIPRVLSYSLLFSVATDEHLIRLIDHKHLEVLRLEVAPLNHVLDASGRSRDDLHAGLERLDVLADGLAADAAVRRDVHVIAERHHHVARLDRKLASGRQDESLRLTRLRIDGLEHADAEDGGLASAKK
jgi:hypothetical protein